MVVAWTIAESLAKDGMRKLREARIPLYPSAERAVKSVESLCRYGDFRQDWQEKKEYYSKNLITEKLTI